MVVSFYLGVFTLGGLEGSGIDVGGDGGGGVGDSLVVSLSAVVANMVARIWSAESFSVSIPVKGLAGAGVRTAAMKLVRAAVAVSADAVFGIGVCLGNHLTVSAMHSARVSMMKSR